MTDFLTIEQFSGAMRKVEAIFNVDKRLPEPVFKPSYRFYLFCEFSLEWHFLELLQKMHSPLASETVLLAVLDPDPIDYFYKFFQKTPAYCLKANIGQREFNELGRRELDSLGKFADRLSN